MARSPQRWLRGWRISSRLRLIVTAPLVAVLGFAGLALTANATQARQASTLQELANVGLEAGQLAYMLQCERGDATKLLTTGQTASLDIFIRQTAETDAAIHRYSAMRSRLGSAPAAVAARLASVSKGLAGLPSLRQRIRSADQGSASAAAFSYRIMIADLLAYRTAVAQAGLSSQLADDLRAASALSDMIEYAGQEQVAVLRALAGGQLTQAMQHSITETRTGFSESNRVFLSLAQQDWRGWWERTDSGDQAAAAQRLLDRVGRTAPGDALGIDGATWSLATAEWLRALSDIQARVDSAVVDRASVARGDQIERAGLNAGAMALALLLTVLVTTVVARQITRQLQRLREAANTVAFDRLPAVVHELRVSSRAATISPDQVATRSAKSVRAAFGLDRSGADEISEVVQAFTEVHQAAVRTAAEQAIMRANTADIFVHLSRRCQRLVDSVLAQVDVVERDETDPDRLQQLYELDNLATRMSRINASLLVLGGVGIGRVRHEPVPLSKILQAALSQIQHYTRVRFGIVDQGVSVIAEAVDDTVHLFAELMDNATIYSPPDSEAWVTARWLGDRVIVQIGDEGVGLPPQRRAALNDLLTRPPAVDVAAIRSMGLVVVGHLAARFGARVELRAGPRLGTIAEVTLTPEVFHTAEQLGAAPSGQGIDHRFEPAGALPAGALPAGPPPTWPPALVVDEVSTGSEDVTAELPIFQQVNNWFHPHVPAPQAQVPAQQAAGQQAAGQQAAGQQRSGPSAAGGQTVSVSPPVPAPAARGPRQRQRQPGQLGQPFQSAQPGQSGPPSQPAPGAVTKRDIPIQMTPLRRQAASTPWRTRSDEAWKAAAALDHVCATDLTSAGLPQRVPQQHLVPQAPNLAEHQSNADRRDPTTVAAALSAYARGVAGRQIQPAPEPPASRAGSRS